MSDLAKHEEAQSRVVGSTQRTLAGPNADFMSTLAQQESIRRARDIAQGRLISADHLALALGWSGQAVDSARVAGRMFGFEATPGNHVYPAFYADPAIPFGDLEAITLALGAAPASGKWQFFTTPKMSLEGRTPLQALSEGDRQAVMRSATGFVER